MKQKSNSKLNEHAHWDAWYIEWKIHYDEDTRITEPIYLFTLYHFTKLHLNSLAGSLLRVAHKKSVPNQETL